MDRAEHLRWLQVEGVRLGDAARAVGVDTPVPTCPGWSVADLLVHIANVYRHKTFVLTTGARERPVGDAWRRPVPAPDEALVRFDEELAALVDALEVTDPSTPVWTWWPADRTAGFWRRRMAHETVIHRADAEAAAGAVTTVDAALAVDGVDEVLDLFLVPDVQPGTAEGPPRTVHLHATDAPGEWLVGLGHEGVTVARGHAKGDAALRGTASDLLLWLWGRAPVDRLDLFGEEGSEEGAVTRLRAIAATVTA